MTHWRTTALSLAERFFWRPSTPAWLKDLGWKLINYAAVGGLSNPFSYLVRPVLSHPKIGVALGGVLVAAATAVMVVSPEPVFNLESAGGPEVVILEHGQPAMSTLVGVRKPLDNIEVSQRFGALHSGIDLRAPKGTPIWAIKSGKVVQAERTFGGYGMLVVIEHKDGYASWYGHMSKINTKVGEVVDTNTIIGEVGSTGRSTGPHLHLEIRDNGRIINPAPILGIANTGPTGLASTASAKLVVR